MSKPHHHDSYAAHHAVMTRKVRTDVKQVSARQLFFEELDRFRTVMAKNPESLSIMLSVLEFAALAENRREEFIHRLEDFRQSLAERNRFHHREQHPDLVDATDEARGHAVSAKRSTWESPSAP